MAFRVAGLLSRHLFIEHNAVGQEPHRAKMRMKKRDGRQAVALCYSISVKALYFMRSAIIAFLTYLAFSASSQTSEAGSSSMSSVIS